MKLDHECVRDILIYVEDTLGLKQFLTVEEDVLPQYSVNDVVYAAEKLIEAGYLNGKIRNTMDQGSLPIVTIASLTWVGHSYLDNIRSNTVWEPTKSVIAKIGSASLGMAGQIASTIITQLISKQMGL